MKTEKIQQKEKNKQIHKKVQVKCFSGDNQTAVGITRKENMQRFAP